MTALPMGALLTGAIGVLAACGTWLLLRARTYPVVLGLMLLGYAANLLLLAMGRLRDVPPPVLVAGDPARTPYADPVPQALVLTAIVIGFGMSALALALSIRARAACGTDHVDGADGIANVRRPSRREGGR
ncbi:MAG TPA: Na+/H+ antiporter subunit C [Gemmatirosa sp.]|jgi:multicomponent K+:H+ antiporter subunit C|nr:Na+/H+ antiporter subunit C [Gemmatirosa sp.]